MNYEGQICRAPMERGSFMLPVMVGCSYNACKFCTLFKHLKYRDLPFEQIEKECLAVKLQGGSPRKIFLGDGNAFTFSAEYLLKIIRMIRKHFPDVQIINMDATVTSVLEKSDAELKALYEAGVRHLYLGIESGLDDVLQFMKKDHTLAEAYLAIERLRKAGLFFDAHMMTGIAGHGRGEENALALAEFYNRTHPAHVCNFSLFLHDEAPLAEDIRKGLFVPASELENLQEDHILLSNIKDDPDHPLKYDGFHDCLGLRVLGTLPKDKARMLAMLEGAIEEEKKMEEPEYSYFFNGDPKLIDAESGKYIWEKQAG